MDLNLILLAKNGDGLARESIIEANKEFIKKYSSYICKRILNWENDDELSIALIAFNEAIDSFQGGNFEVFSKTVMKNRLIDYFRKNGKGEILLDDEILYNLESTEFDIAESLSRKEQINLFQRILKLYDIDLNDLTKKSPKHRDTRENLKEIAKKVSEEVDLLFYIRKNHTLPIKEITLRFSVSRKLLDEWRKYLISLILILSDMRLESIKEYLEL